MTVPMPKSADERKDALDREIAQMVVKGFRVESQTDYQVVLVSGNRVNHILHLLLTVFTFGVWVIVWILLVILGGEKRRVVSIDDHGNIFTNK